MNEPKVVRTNLDPRTALVSTPGMSEKRNEISRFAADVVRNAVTADVRPSGGPPSSSPAASR